MTRSRTQLGDSHNFGRRVSLRAGRVHKPRALLWEWLLLAEDSPLRQKLAAAAEREGLGRDAFAFLPTLRFHRWDSREGGEVEKPALRPLARLSSGKRRELAVIVGRSLGLWSWLGVADLHWENLVLGVDAEERTVFGPLDIEMILAELSLPTETKLIPDADPEYAAICRHASGVRRVLPYLGKPIRPDELLAMLCAYRGTLAFLDRQGKALARVFANLPGLREAPIRVCLRGTGDYVQARSEPIWPPLLDAEAEQMARGDIPYFFRLYGRAGIHYYGNQELTRLKTLPLEGDVPRLDPLLSVARGLGSKARQKLREDGLFAVIAAFDDPSFTGIHHSEELEVKFGARTLVVKLPGGEELHSRRNLRAYVSSVYLPCRCGEVRSVFVPEVTVCKPKG